MSRRPRHQVVLQLMPGAEPWVRIETYRGVYKLPAACSLTELLEVLNGHVRPAKAPTGELLVRARLDQLITPQREAILRSRGQSSARPVTGS